MRVRRGLCTLVVAWVAALSAMHAPAQGLAPAQSRGALLYDNHCIACHNTQVHWRDARRVTNWTSLTAEVRRWQDSAQLGWSEDDIAEVARFLNQRYYRLKAADTQIGRLHDRSGVHRHPAFNWRS